MPDTIVQPPSDMARWFAINMPSCGEWDFIHANLNRVIAMYGIGAPYQGGFGAYELGLRQIYPNTPCQLKLPTAKPVIQPTAGSNGFVAKAGHGLLLIPIAIIAFLYFAFRRK